MARNNAPGVVFALALLAIAISVTLADDKCRSGCQGSPQIFKYAQGTTYKYNVEGVVDVSLSSAEGQQTSTKLRATALVTALPQCDYLLRLQNVQVIGPDGKKYSNIPGIEKSVRFNFNDGLIDDSICIEHGDTQNSLNIKRAVISLFQAATKKHHETDVFGLCPTNIQTRSEGGNLIIQKTRNLNKCAFRENIKQDFMSTTFNLNSEIKSSPILNGEYSSEQRIKNGILDHAIVSENYLYVPFSVGNNGAKATVSTKIQYVGTAKEAPVPKCTEPRSIIFESPHLVNTENSNVDSISAALKDTKNTIDLTVGEYTARAFINLIKIFRASKKNDILAVYGQVQAGAGFKDKVGTKKVFLDALFRAGTGDTIEVAIELLKNRELNPLEQKLVYLGMAFVKHATLSSLSCAAGLLDQPNLPREAYLGIGILAGQYCREHSCKHAAEVDQLTQKLLSKLGEGKASNRKVENEIISILKAFGNFESLNDVVIPKIIQIAQDKKAPNRVRVAALDTYLADACKDKLRDSALGILKDIQQDSEIRIKAYLVVAKCPNGKIASAIKGLLEHEPSYQVGGFITSHLRSLKASADPEKAFAKQQLGQISTTNRFPIDLRKYSFNNEISYAIDSLGISSSVETDVIYSYNSFLPRSVNLNVSMELFGNKLNVLEVDIRQENLNRVMEEYLGPLGEFSDVTSDELLKTGKESVGKIVKHFQDRLATTRGKREVPKADIDNINKQVQIKTSDLNKDVDLDLSVKMFGSEILFLSLTDESEKFSIDTLIDKIFDDIDKGIAKAKNFDNVLQSNALFIDSEFSYPTSVGYALRLAVEGSSSAQIKTATKIDIKGLLNEQKSPIKLTLIPSISVEIRGSLLIDAQIIENGLTVSSTLYSATGGDLDINCLGEGKGIDIKFSLPVEDQKLIAATHEIVFNTRELGKPEVTVPVKFGQNKDFNICLDQLSPVLGTTLCIDLNNPPSTGKPGTLPFPLSGNGKFAVGIHRDDLSHFHYTHLFHNSPDKLGVEVIFETMGTKQDKKLNLNFELCFAPEPFIKAAVFSPIKRASIEGRVTNTNQEKSISVTLQHDDQKYLGKVGLAVSGGGGKTTYKPILYYDGPGTQGQGLPVKVEGAITVEQVGGGTKYVFDDVRLILPNHQTFSVKGLVGNEPGALFSDITVSNGKDSGSLNGKIQLHPDLKVFAELKNSINPHFNVKLDYSYKRQPHQVDTNFLLIHGPDLNSQVNRITASSFFMYKRKGAQDFEGKTEEKFAYPLLGIDARFLHAIAPKYIKCEVDFKYTDLKIGTALDFQFNQKTVGDYGIAFLVYGKDNKIKLDATREITGEKSKVTNCLDINGKKIEVDGIITHHSRPDDINIGSDLVVKIPGRSEPIKVQNGLVLNPNDLDVHLKIASGSEIYVDFFLKSDKDRNANGNIKVSLRDIISANGQVNVKGGVGTAFIIVELAQMKRKLKVDTSFTIIQPTYKCDLSLYFDYEADNNNKWFLSTNTQASGELVDSKNIVDFRGRKFELNFKTEGKFKLYDTKFTTEFELILPSNDCVLFKWNRDLKSTNGVVSGVSFASLEHRENKNKPGCKATVKGDFKHIDLKNTVYDINYKIIVDSTDGNLLNLDYTGKRNNKGDQKAVDEVLKIAAPCLKTPVELTCSALYKDDSGSLTFKSNGGHSVLINAKYDNDDSDKKIFGEVTGDIGLNSKYLKVIKFSLFGSRDDPQDNEIHTKIALSLFVDDDGTKPEATIDYKIQAETSIKPENSRLKGVINIGKEDPVSVDYGYAIKHENGVNKIIVDAIIQYAKDKVIKTDLCTYQPSPNEFNLDVSFDSPFAPNNKIQVYTKRSPDGQVFNGEFIILTDNRKFILNSELALLETAPGFLVKFIYPNGKTDIIAVKMNRVAHFHYNGDVKIVLAERDFILENTWDAKLESIDNFNVKIATNSPALKLDNLVIEAQNVPSKTGKRIQVTAKSAGQNILAGSTNYHAREEGGKYIVEGSGAFKIYQDTKQANFKFVSQKLTEIKNGEEGFEVSFNAGLGASAIDTEFKTTSKHFRVLNSYCEEKQQCAYIEIDSKINNLGGNELNHELELAVDLRKLGLSHEFGLKAQTSRKTLALDHNVDMYFQNKENKYQYSVNVHPRDASVTLTTPKRIICFEANLNSIPQGRGNSVKGEIALYLNKKTKPNEKTALTFVMESNPPTKKASLNDGYSAVVKFINPALGRDLSISYVAKYDLSQLKTEVVSIIDIFPNANHKIVVNVRTSAKLIGTNGLTAEGFIQAKSDGLNFDIKMEEYDLYDLEQYVIKYKYLFSYNVGGSNYDSEILFEADKSHGKIVAKALNKEILNVDSQIQSTKDSLLTNTNIIILGVEPTSTQLEIKPDSAKYSAWRTSNPSNKLVASAAVIKGPNGQPSSIDMCIDIWKSSEQIDLVKWNINLNRDHFLQGEPKVNIENIKKTCVTIIQKDIKKFIDELKICLEGAVQDTRAQTDKVAEALKKNIPSLKPVKEYYQRELESLKDELVSDKTIKEVSDFLKNLLGAVVHAFSDVFGRFSIILEKVLESLQQQSARVIQLINKEIVPEITEEFQKVLKFGAELSDKLTDLFFTLLASADSWCKAHKEEIQQLTGIVSGLWQDVTRLIYSLLDEAQHAVGKEWNNIYRGLKNNRVAEELKAKYQQIVGDIQIPDILLHTFKEVAGTIKDAVPFDEVKRLITATVDYVEKKFKNQRVDDLTAIQNILSLAVQAIGKLFDTIVATTKGDFQLPEKTVPLFSVQQLYNLPTLAGIRLSPITYLANNDLPSLVQALYAFSLNPSHWFPPYELDAVIVQGQHLFTFDGKLITFPGNCNYLLARDAYKGRFTVIGTLTNGILTEITFADKVDTITIKKGGQIFVNNAPSEFPVIQKYTSAFRTYEGINLVSKLGVRISCGPELFVCGVHVSGYYHSDLRGLLGNGNSEPFDDFTLPNGKIVTSEGEFGNSYQVGASCPPVKPADHEHHQPSPSCSKWFNSDSPLSVCFKFVKPDNYRHACEHGVAAGVPDTEKGIVMGYVVACRSKFIPVQMPKEFVQCTNDVQPYSLGETFSVKVPKKMADIILVIDQARPNEVVFKELLQPLVQQLTTELSAQGLTDVEYHLIGYGGENQDYITHYTVDGKLTYKGTLPDVKFSDVPKPTFISTGSDYLDTFQRLLQIVVYEIDLITLQTPPAKAYLDTLQYPFRPQAVKAIVGLSSTPCKKGLGLVKLRSLLMGNKLISINSIMPFDYFSTKDPKNAKNVIGFNTNGVFTFSDARKKPEGDPELIKELEYDDICADFTLKHHGNVFVANNFLQAKPPQRKQFAFVAAHNIAYQLVNVEQGLDCECKLSTPYTAQNTCKVVYNREKEVADTAGKKSTSQKG